MGPLAALALFTYSRLSGPDAAPSPRFDPPLIFDAGSRALLLFGGSDSGAPRNDLWLYSIDENRWKELHPRGALPPARFGHSTIYDPVRGRLILFGGQAGGFFSDVWAFDVQANEWTRLAQNGAGPSSRYGHSGIYDSKRDRLVISHGFTDAGRFDDTWAFGLSNNRWTNLTPSGTKPLKRCLHHAAYDEKHDQFLLFGGCSSGFGKCPQDDLWSFDLNANRWNQLAAGPPARERYAMAFDAKRGQLLIFGGSGFPLFNDTWTYDVEMGAWSAIEAEGDVPAPRSRVEGVYAEGLDAAFWFGGSTDAGLSNELFRLDFAAASGISRVVNAFSGEGGSIAPGELVTVFGNDLEAPVTFGSVPGATLFSSPIQINTRVPDSLAAGQEIQLGAGGLSKARVTVAAAHPGLFMNVWNADGTVNSAGNPAAAGTAVTLYATGTGPNRIDVSISGATAEVLNSGPLAGALGVVRIDVLVPASSSSGSNSVSIMGSNTIQIGIR